jgi:hypothetical protein
MKITLPLSLWLALAPCLPATPPDPVPAAQDARAAALAWLQAKGIPFTPDAFIQMCATGGKDSVEPFLAAGMAPGTRDTRGMPALVAVLSQWQNLMRPEFNAFRGKLVTDRLEVLDLLLAHGADPGAWDASGFTALHHAACYDQFCPAIARLHKAGADPDAAHPPQNLKPLHLAVMANNAAGAQALLEAGAAPNGDADPALAPLANAVREDVGSKADHSRLVNVLLHYGADLKVRIRDQASCLHLAATGASLKTIRVLVAAGADRKAQDALQRTPYDIAKASHRAPEVLAALAPDA